MQPFDTAFGVGDNRGGGPWSPLWTTPGYCC